MSPQSSILLILNNPVDSFKRPNLLGAGFALHKIRWHHYSSFIIHRCVSASRERIRTPSRQLSLMPIMKASTSGERQRATVAQAR